MSRDGYDHLARVQEVMGCEGSTLRDEVQRWRRETAGMGPVARIAWWFTPTTRARLSDDFPEVLATLRTREHSEAEALEAFERAVDEALAVANNHRTAKRPRAARAVA